MTKPGIFIRYFDYDRRLIPNRYVAEMEEGVTTLEEAKARTGKTVGYPGWNLLYYAAFCSFDRSIPNIVVETGTHWGFSTIMLAQALRDSKLAGHVHSVEIMEEHYRRACENVKKAGVDDLISLHLGDAQQFLREFVAGLDGTIRFAFLDGSHSQDDTVQEFELVYPKLTDESTVFFDNTYPLADDDDPDQRVNGALRVITERYGGNLVNFPNCSWCTPGQAIWQRAPFAGDWEKQRGRVTSAS